MILPLAQALQFANSGLLLVERPLLRAREASPGPRLAVLVPETLPSIQPHVDVGLHVPSPKRGISETTSLCEILRTHVMAHLGHHPAIGWKHLKTNPCMETLENHAFNHLIWKFLKTRLLKSITYPVEIPENHRCTMGNP